LSHTTFDYRADVYAFGIILWELFSRQNFFSDLVFYEIVDAVLSGAREPIPAYCPDAVKDLIEACWV
jgi:hypothetical protein